MKRRTLLAGAAALAAAPAAAPSAARGQTAGRTRIVFWHAMTAALGEEVNRICTAFNASQGEIEVQPIYKGSYPETLTAVIAAWRANQAPHLVQMFEVGTGSMLAAGPAVKQVWQLAQETGVTIDPAAYIPAVRGYYSLPDGRLASMPFNSSTAVMWFNKDAFEKAGLDPEHPPATWEETVAAARTIRDKGAANVPMTTSWPTWIQFEEYSAIHDIPFATKADGFEGLDAELKINSPAHVKHLARLLEMAKEGTFKYGGRNSAADPLFTSGEAAIAFNSSGNRGDIARTAKFRWASAFLPYDPEINPKPINSIIGGASLWTMTAKDRTPAEYKGVAQFLTFIALPENDALWHQHTGYVPVTLGGYELSRKQGYYDRNPGADLPIRQLTRGDVTANSKGFRLGRMPEIRNIMQEEIEKALQGQQDAQTALDASVARGNVVLRQFEKSVRT
jgi:sn-glycerol 3-phosphate transport system substrate-binding protein